MHSQNLMIFGTCKLHTTTSGAVQILNKFYHNKHLKRDLGSTRLTHTVTYNFKLLQIVYLL